MCGIGIAHLADESKVKCRKGVHGPTDSPGLARWTRLAWTCRRQVGECCQARDGVSSEHRVGI